MINAVLTIRYPVTHTGIGQGSYFRGLICKT